MKYNRIHIVFKQYNHGQYNLYFSQISHAFSVPTSTPAFPETTIIAASAAATASSTSPIKSKNPGVSKIFILIPSHSTGITDVEMEVVEDMTNVYGKKMAPFHLPIRENEKFVGYVNVITETGHRCKPLLLPD